ncbi:hypothetical protein BH11ARM2_BH11ARM2_14090 [soil metagenome]
MSPGQALVPFGFTALESEIYAFLARESPATGYRIAQGIGKPAANVYKALQTLESKGAVLVEDGDAKQVRAVVADELLSRLTREFGEHQKSAKDAFARMARPTEDERVYTFRAAEAALSHARDRLAEARHVVVAALGLEAQAALAEDLRSAKARGVDVVVLTEDGSAPEGIEAHEGAVEDELRLVADAQAGLTGRLGIDPWVVASRSATFAEGLHRGIAAEIALAEVQERIEEGGGAKRVTRALERLRLAPKTA